MEVHEAVLRRPFIDGGRVYSPLPGGEGIGLDGRELDISIHDTMMVNDNNQGSMAMAKDPVFHDHSKHLNIQCHFPCDLVKEGRITLGYVSA